MKPLYLSNAEARQAATGRVLAIRPVRPQPPDGFNRLDRFVGEWATWENDVPQKLASGVTGLGMWTAQSPWKTGDVVLGREAWTARTIEQINQHVARALTSEEVKRRGWIWYRADNNLLSRWISAARMPDWAVRYRLRAIKIECRQLGSVTEEESRVLVPHCPVCEPPACGHWGRGAIDDPLAGAAGGRPYRQCGGVCDGLTAAGQFQVEWCKDRGKRVLWPDGWVWFVQFEVV